MGTSNTPTTPSRRPTVQTASNTPTTPSRRPKVQIEVTRSTRTTTMTTERVVWIDSDTEPPTPSPPSSPTRAPSRPQAGVASPSQSVTEAQNILRKPSPEELVEPALPADAYYVVTVGRRTGIFSSWLVASPLCKGEKDSTWKKCATWEQAYQEYEDAFGAGLVKSWGASRAALSKTSSLCCFLCCNHLHLFRPSHFGIAPSSWARTMFLLPLSSDPLGGGCPGLAHFIGKFFSVARWMGLIEKVSGWAIAGFGTLPELWIRASESTMKKETENDLPLFISLFAVVRSIMVAVHGDQGKIVMVKSQSILAVSLNGQFTTLNVQFTTPDPMKTMNTPDTPPIPYITT
ncbi:hypothetical protein GGX14DRAFT_406729 [Mycena pura]|uniref:Ribonuclease H1 N-terminal domain-containing protein n=1 Tax=Mycena pura TaxID=153505 RepID=A0AAD6UWT0_9AGAR|nr:hypothetical protein GGX14DRAFT_406729 [Mycena pura]